MEHFLCLYFFSVFRFCLHSFSLGCAGGGLVGEGEGRRKRRVKRRRRVKKVAL